VRWDWSGNVLNGNVENAFSFSIEKTIPKSDPDPDIKTVKTETGTNFQDFSQRRNE
jgi:hypothetical protein